LIRKYYPHGYYGVDKIVIFLFKGRPIYIEQIGLLNHTELFKVTDEDRMVKYFIKSF
jgi:hypothetical protein